MAEHIACGTVNGRNGFGAMAGQSRFIYFMGSVAFDDGSRKFARRWNTICVEKLLSAAPTGVMGFRWGSHPTAALKLYAPPTDGLSLYVPRGDPSPLEGVPVKEADFRFDYGRLAAGDFFIDGETNRDAVKAALTKKYGHPLSADDDSHNYEWRWPDRQVSIELSYDERSKRTSVTFARGPH